jgi:hypothetical protein
MSLINARQLFGCHHGVVMMEYACNDLAGCIPMQITTQNFCMSNERSFY